MTELERPDITGPEISDDGGLLRPWRADDAESLVAICDEAEVAFRTPLPSPFTSEDARTFLRGRPGYLDLAITDTDGVAVGLVSINRATQNASYIVGAQARGQGTASRALQRACQVARRDLGLDRLFLEIEPDNRASAIVAERNGFRPSDLPVEEVEDKGRVYSLATWERAV